MGRLEAIKIFTRVAETNSFSRTADLLDLPRGTVSRTIQTLEDQLSVRLFSRSTRQVSLTDAGRMYYEQCAKIIGDLSEVEARLSTARSSASGTVRIDTSGTIARSLILPSLQEFLDLYPDIDVRVGLADRNIDLIQEGVDCVIRAGSLEESSLVARRIGNAKVVTCAAPSYFEKHGIPGCPKDLTAHTAVNYFSSKTGKVVPFEFEQDQQLYKLTLKSKFTVNEGNAYVDAALQGFGIIQPSRYIVEEYLKHGTLKEVLSEFRTPAIPISIVYPHRNHVSSATRCLTNWIADICSKHPDLSTQG
ncbi:LysR family transcriptional regulator [Burkholderia sp. THE68]|uniref:LysR substrate-binding domain-containing protein n=1 Tax=Burkholderia sp. THE68 TaxID=758782 RepID=UPI001315B3FC|nr:LysR family transcriptional regulator [Burkholderia sp. THE68]BBU30334.1 LysR family transcriptional regulator [Burkholderia sp. THE68]